MKRRSFLQLTALSLITPAPVPANLRHLAKPIWYPDAWTPGPLRFIGDKKKVDELLCLWKKHWPAHAEYLQKET
jgi:hypothetical protein